MEARVAPGVLVHLHDIFLPYEYPCGCIVEEWRFRNEQYLLRAFPAFNGAVEVVMAKATLVTVTTRISKPRSRRLLGGEAKASVSEDETMRASRRLPVVSNHASAQR